MIDATIPDISEARDFIIDGGYRAYLVFANERLADYPGIPASVEKEINAVSPPLFSEPRFLLKLYSGRSSLSGGDCEFGLVAVNRSKETGVPIPFCGLKQSGVGREGARQGMEVFLDIKYFGRDWA